MTFRTEASESRSALRDRSRMQEATSPLACVRFQPLPRGLLVIMPEDCDHEMPINDVDDTGSERGKSLLLLLRSREACSAVTGAFVRTTGCFVIACTDSWRAREQVMASLRSVFGSELTEWAGKR